MKTKKMFSVKTLSVVLVSSVALLYSCKRDNDILNSTDTQNVNSESVSASSSDETGDMTISAISNISDTQYNGGRLATEITGLGDIDKRFAGATVTLTLSPNSNTTTPQGTIIIDFKDGVTDVNGVIRKGQIIINYLGRRFANGATKIISFNGYSRNGVVFDNAMTLTLTNESDITAVPFKIHYVLANGKLTFPDATTILRRSDIHAGWDATAKTITHYANVSQTVHSAGGTTRAGKEYTMDITKDLVYSFSADCLAAKVFIAVIGTKTITAGAFSYTIDYRNGSCDNTITVTLAGKSKDITVSGNGN